MNNQKLQNFFGCLGMLLFGLIVVFFFLLTWDIIPPVRTWKPSLRIAMVDRNTVEGDSLYLACLREKADILERKGQDKRALKTRKQIVNYYEEKGDRESVDYVLELYNCFKLAPESTNINIKKTRDILWGAWENGKLQDSQKIELYYILSPDNDSEKNFQPADEPIYKQMLDVALSIQDPEYKQDLIVSSITALVTIYLRDMNHVDKITQYIPLLLEAQCKEKVSQVIRWVILTRYYLLTHNTIEAQTCLDAAKSLRLKQQEITEIITRLQKAIYEANGDIQNGITEGRHLIALNAIEIEKHTLRWENAIKLSRKFQARYYCRQVNNDLEKIISAYKQKDTIPWEAKWSFKKYYTQVLLLNIEHCLKFTDVDPTVLLNEASQWISVSPEEQLKYINLSIQTSLQYPSDTSIVLLQNGLNALKMRLQYTFPHFTDGEKASFWLTEEPVLRQIYAASNAADVKYNVALLSKGLLLTSSNRVRRAILDSNDSLLIEDWNHLQMLRQAELLNIESSAKDMQIIRYKADSLERSVTQRSLAYQQFQNTWDITWEDVQSQLNDNECAIEIVHYPIENDVQYDALIIRKNDSIPISVHIGRESSYNVDASDMFTKRSYLIDTIWSPICPYLQNGKVYISMDGWFHHHNLEAMVANANGELLSDLYQIIRVSSTRELVQSDNHNFTSAALYGGVEYDFSENETPQNIIRTETEERGFRSVDSKILTVNPLPYTLVEVQEIDTLLRTHGCSTKLYINENATEDAFKKMSGDSIQILHISTHGIANQIPDGSSDPMRFCCLLLAGANNSLLQPKDAKNKQDGILTASEISTLDFSGTKLVVLSACNTAKGTVTADGVFGLQRAFKQAGVESILMSLTKVYDATTAEFMHEYYRQLVNGCDKHTALTRTRTIIRNKYPNSMDWASFILLD